MHRTGLAYAVVAVLLGSTMALVGLTASSGPVGHAPALAPTPALDRGSPLPAAVSPDYGSLGIPYVVTTIATGGEPQFAAYDPTSASLYVPNWASANVSVVHGTTVVATIAVGSIPFSTTYDPTNGYVYVVNEGSGTVTVVDGTAVLGNVTVGTTPQYATYDSGNGYVYVSDSASASVSVIAGLSLVATIPVGKDPSGPIVAGGTGGGGWNPTAGSPLVTLPDVYVPNTGSNNVSIIGGATTTTIMGSIPVGSEPGFGTYDPSNAWVYVPNQGSNNVSVLGTSSVLYTVPVGHYPWSATYDSYNADVYVANWGSGTVSVIGGTNGNTVIATPTVGSGPEFVSPGAGALLFVPNTGSGTVSVLDGTSLLGSVFAGTSPIFGSYDPATGYMYVQNFGSSNVTVVGLGFLVKFREVGLLSGASWSVTAGSPSVRHTGTVPGPGTELSFMEPLGALSYSFGAPAGYGVAAIAGPPLPNQSGAVITANTTLVVTFGLFETLTFSETGLASGALWGVAISSALLHGGPAAQSLTTTGTSLAFTVVKDAWKFEVTPKPSLDKAIPGRGVVIVPAHALTKPIHFELVTAVVIFRETGLALGTTWGVNVTGPMNLSLTARAPAVVRFVLENGTYNFSAWNFSALHPHPASGTFTVVAPHLPVSHVIGYTTTAVVRAVPIELRPATGVPLSPSNVLAGVALSRGRSG